RARVTVIYVRPKQVQARPTERNAPCSAPHARGTAENHCNSFRPVARARIKGKYGGIDIRQRPWPRGHENFRDASARPKKKPEILRSRAKSTKGGGWRRQPGHVGVNTAISLPGSTATQPGLGTAPTAFQHP